METRGTRALGRMNNKETSKFEYTKPLLCSGWSGVGVETGDDGAK